MTKKTVPLVVYRGGERIVIGEADVDENGGVSARVSPDAPADVRDAFQPDYTTFSVDGSPLETALIPPLLPSLKGFPLNDLGDALYDQEADQTPKSTMFDNSLSLNVTTKGEVDAAEVFHRFIAIAEELRPHYSSVNVSSYRIEDGFGVSPEGELYYDDNTMEKVKEAITEVFPNIPGPRMMDLIAAFQNRGILFRERRV